MPPTGPRSPIIEQRRNISSAPQIPGQSSPPSYYLGPPNTPVSGVSPGSSRSVTPVNEDPSSASTPCRQGETAQKRKADEISPDAASATPSPDSEAPRKKKKPRIVVKNAERYRCNLPIVLGERLKEKASTSITDDADKCRSPLPSPSPLLLSSPLLSPSRPSSEESPSGPSSEEPLENKQIQIVIKNPERYRRHSAIVFEDPFKEKETTSIADADECPSPFSRPPLPSREEPLKKQEMGCE